LKEWYVISPNLLVHLRAYLLQALVVRFLLFGHPALLEVAGSTDRELRGRTLDRALVEAVSRVSRASEHNPAFVQQLEAALPSDPSEPFASTAILTAV
jgi:hypothetical protein